MAELTSNLTNSGNITKIECAVCLQPSIHPAELPCGHVFCYLCIKGIVNQGRRCAMCRQDIPVDYLDKPKLLNPMDAEVTSQGFEDGHLWFYEGHNGWWQYDERSSIELESAYQKGERCCDLLIAGFLYIADFDGMVQYRRNDPSRRRRIKRDLATTSKKGIAGLKATKSCNLAPSSSPEVVSNELIQNLNVPSSANSLSGVRTSLLSNSGQHVGARGIQQSQRAGGSSSQSSISVLRPTSSTVPEVDHTLPAIGNLNFDIVLHDSLDRTIEQIESLNSELLNDFEALFRDVNNYGQLQDSLTQSRPRRRPNNYMSRYLNTSNPASLSHQNEMVSTDRRSSLSPSNVNNLNNLNFESSASSLVETNPIYSEPAETLSPLQSRASSPPQPPPRIRGMSRSSSRTDSLRRPSLS